jgi:hypothetical protein
VPLSEHEQRLLEQMEQAMYAEDPKFASAMRGRSSQARHRRRLLLGAVALAVGLAMVVLGVARSFVWLAVIGFVVMVAGVAWAATPERRSGPVGAVGTDGQTVTRRPRAKAARQTRNAGFMDRLEQRWDRRRESGWGG